VNGHELRTLLRGALRPPDNDSAFLLDGHRRAVPRERMARYDDSHPVDLVIVGAGAGGGTLAQRLARRGWKVVVLEAGPFWDPDEDWVSDEAGSHKLYWTEERVTGGKDPVELGKNNSGHGGGARWSITRATARAFTPRTSRCARATEWGRTGRSPTPT
jgi:choline dehydrogenase-like flavoprotein